jgi:type VI secretion system secreted protein VgrG
VATVPVSSSDIYVKAEVELDGSHIVTPISSLTLNQYSNWHHSFEVRAALDTIEDRQQISFSRTHDFIGKTVKIAFKTQDGNKQYALFKGIITEVNLSRYGGSASDVVIRGYSPSILLDDGPHCMGFLEKSLKQIATRVTSLYPMNLVNPKVSPSSDPKISYVAQYNESAYNFLSRLASIYGQWFYYNGTELIFGKLENQSPLTLSFGHDLMSFEAAMRIAPMKFEAYSYDIKTQDVFKVDSSGETVAGLDNWGEKASAGSDSVYGVKQIYHVNENVPDASALRNVVLNRKSAIAGELVRFTGTSANPMLTIGSKVTIKGGSRASMGDDVTDYGTYTITQISHHSDGMGGYKNTFEAIPGTLEVPPYNNTVKQPVCETQPAVVTDNQDPEKGGRVKVRFFWQKEGESTDWVRMITAQGGKNRGFYWLPELGDEVMVGFESENPSRPYILGSNYNLKNHSADRHEPKNHIKTIRTISGNEITFNDKGGEEAIHLFTRDKKNEVLITMKDDGLIRISSNKKIYVQATEEIEMKSKMIKIEATDTLEMKAKTVKAEAQQLMQLESQQDLKEKGMNVTVEAVSKMEMKSQGSLEAKANSQLAVSSMGTASVKGTAQLELSASGQASLKGAIVMIN